MQIKQGQTIYERSAHVEGGDSAIVYNVDSGSAVAASGGVAAATGGVAVGGDVHGDINVFSRTEEQELDEFFERAVAGYENQLLKRLRKHPTSPYKFLLPFALEDSEIFCGRDQCVQELLAALNGNQGDHRLLIVHAPSGAGKTSLLQAGLGKSLVDDNRLPIYARAYEDPIAAIKRAVIPAQFGAQPARLDALDLCQFLGRVVRFMGSDFQGLVIILDQFEEFFIFERSDALRASFIDSLAEVVDDAMLPINIILAIRKDYFSDLAQFKPRIRNIFTTEYHVGKMNRIDATEAITGPLRKIRSHLVYEEALVEQLLDDLTGNGIELPQLQIVCTRLYELQRDKPQITLAEYESLGGAKGILGSYLNEAIGRIEQDDRSLAKQLLASLISTQGTKRPQGIKQLERSLDAPEAAITRILDNLVNDRLLQRYDTGDSIVYELAHDLLAAEITKWQVTMVPTGEQLSAIHEALLNAFSLSDLKMMLRFELDDDLDTITATHARNFTEITFGVVSYYASQAQGLNRLLSAASHRNPRNFGLRAVMESTAGIQFAPIKDPEFPVSQADLTRPSVRETILDADELRQLQDALLSAFSLDELERMVSVELDITLNHIIPVLGRTMRQITADLITYYAGSPTDLYQLMNGAISQNPNNSRLQAAMQLVLRIMPSNTAMAQNGQMNDDIQVDTSVTGSWTGARFRMLYDGLIRAFNHDELRMMTRRQFDQDLESIVASGSLSQITFDLMRFFQRADQDGLTRLLEGAISERPRNTDLQALMAEISASVPSTNSDTLAHPTPDTDPRDSARKETTRLTGGIS